MEQFPPAPGTTTQAPTTPGGFGTAQAAPEWTPAERPIIRPPVANPGGGAGAPPRRMNAAQMAHSADELGVEESEFDKPAYLRRGIFAPE
jgi:hypothetical protein